MNFLLGQKHNAVIEQTKSIHPFFFPNRRKTTIALALRAQRRTEYKVLIKSSGIPILIFE